MAGVPASAGVVRLRPALKAADWGAPAFFRDFLGGAADLPERLAEIWYGAHPDGPATVVADAPMPLDRWLAAAPQALGDDAPALPYLLKVLAASSPLSIQVHPSREQAEQGLTAEARLPPTAPRSYRDGNPKPELLVALTEFHALAGFRDADGVGASLRRCPELLVLVDPAEDLRTLVEQWFAAPPAAIQQALTVTLARLGRESGWTTSDPEYWMLEAHQSLGGGAPDPGLLFVLLLDLLALRPGQGVFLPAGVPHSYLRGAGVEIMASSDNVLRAGLTRKPVNRAELLRVVRFDARRPAVLDALPLRAGAGSYWPTPASDFGLRRLPLDAANPAALGASNGARIVLCTVGPVTAAGHTLEAGDALFLPAGVALEGRAAGTAGELFVASSGDQALPTVVSRGTLPGEGAGEVAEEGAGEPVGELAEGTGGSDRRGEPLTELDAWINTRGFLDYLTNAGQVVPGTPVVVGEDLRDAGGDGVVLAVIDAIRSAGMEPRWCGVLAARALTQFAGHQGWPAVVITADDLTPGRGRLKFCAADGEVVSAEGAAIRAAVSRVGRWVGGEAASTSRFDDAGRLRSTVRVALPEVDPAAARWSQGRQALPR